MSETSSPLKRFLTLQMTKIRKIAGVGSLFLLVLNLALQLYPNIEQRGVHPYVGIPLTIIGMGILIWIGSHIYVKIVQMSKYESLSEVRLNPYSVNHIAPFEELRYRYVDIPQMEAIYSTMKEGKAKQEFKKNIDIFKEWVELGYIPDKYFPPHLKKSIMYKGKRL
jgi:hypothetical protein